MGAFDDLIPQTQADGFTNLVQHQEDPSGDPDAVSPKGALGTMQVMPATASNPGFGVPPANPNDPAQLAQTGQAYSHAMLAHYGNPVLAAAAYNAGPGTVDDWIGGTNRTGRNPGMVKLGDPRNGETTEAAFAQNIPMAETRKYVQPFVTAPAPNPFADLIPKKGQPSASNAFADLIPKAAAAAAQPKAGAAAATSPITGLPIPKQFQAQSGDADALESSAWNTYKGDVGGAWDKLKSDFLATRPDMNYANEDFWDKLKSDFHQEVALGTLPVDAFNMVMTPTVGAPLDVGFVKPVAAGERAIMGALPGHPTVPSQQSIEGDVSRSLWGIAPEGRMGFIPPRFRATGPSAAPESGNTIEGEYHVVDPNQKAIAGPSRASPSVPASAQAAADMGAKVDLNGRRVAPSQRPAAPSQSQPVPPVGQPIGLKHPQTGEVSHATVTAYHDNGSLASVRLGDGSHAWMDTADLLRDQAAPPETAPPQKPSGIAPTQDERMSEPFPDEEELTRPKPPKPMTGALDPEALGGIDQANILERAATHPASTLPLETRTAMLTEAARLRQKYGFDPSSPAPDSYQHPLANEPARGLGALAAARVRNPALFNTVARFPEPEPASATPQGVQPGDIAKAADEIRREWTTPLPKPTTLIQAIRGAGGLKARNPNGSWTQGAQDILHTIDKNAFGRIVNNRSGLNPDRLRGHLAEHGWFGGNPNDDYANTDLSHLTDLIDRHFNRGTVYNPAEPETYELMERQAFRDELKAAGARRQSGVNLAAQRLAEYRAERVPDHPAREAALDAALTPQEHERAEGYEYVPGADIGAELETPEGAGASGEGAGHQPVAQAGTPDAGAPAADHRQGETGPHPEELTDEDWRALGEWNPGAGQAKNEYLPEPPINPHTGKPITSEPTKSHLALIQQLGRDGDVESLHEAIAAHEGNNGSAPGMLGAMDVNHVAAKYARDVLAHVERNRFNTKPGAVDAKGNPLPQTIIPGAEASMRQQLAAELAKREARGKIEPKKSQKAPDIGLFAKPGETPTESGSQGQLLQPRAPRGWEHADGEVAHEAADLLDKVRERLAETAQVHGEANPDPVNVALRIRRLVLGHGLAHGTEMLVLHDADGTPLAAYTDGRRNGVTFTDPMVDAFNNPGTPVVSHHNHPSGSSFSAADIRSLHYPAHSAMLVHGATGEFYAAMPTPELRASGPTDLRLDAVYRNVIDKLHPIGSDAMQSGAITMDEANTFIHHAVNAALDRAGLTDYLSNREVPSHILPVFDQWVREGAQEAARSANVLNLGRDDSRAGRPYRSPRPIQPEDGIRSVLARVGQQAADASGQVRASGSPALSPTAKPYRTPKQLKLLQPGREYVEQPETPEQGKEYFDNVAGAMAADQGGKGVGNYARMMNRNLGPGGKWNPGAEKSLGDIQRNVILPRTLASMDWRSARYYAAAAAKSEAALKMMADYRDHARPFNDLPEASKDRVLQVAELNRLDGATPQEGRAVVAKNVAHPLAELSKPGETIRLNDDEAKGLFGLRDMHAHEWRDMIAGTAKRLGWDGAPDPQEIRAAADREASAGGVKRLSRIADILEAFQQQERAGYVPLMRHGDYYMAAKEKMQPGDDSLGGFPKTAWYRRVDSQTPWENLFGKSNAQMKGIPKSAMDQIAELNRKGQFGEFRNVDGRWQSPSHEIEMGPVPRDIESLRKMDIPALEKLMQALEHRSGSGDSSFHKNAAWSGLMDEIRDQLYEELKSGFKKQTSTPPVPGYDPDFRRSIGSRAFWNAQHVSEMLHGDEINRARDEIAARADPNVAKFWRQWDHDMETKPGLMAKGANALQNFAFYWEMGANPASTFSILTHGGTVAVPTLSVATPFRTAAGQFLKAQGETLTALRADGEKGLHFGDVSRIGKTPEERAFLNDLEKSGLLHSKMADEFGRLQSNPVTGAFKNHAQRALDIWGSNISVADRLSRIPSALAAYRLAKQPGGFQRFEKAWGNDENFKAVVSRYGRTPEAVGRFMTNEAAFEYGKRNQPAWQRNALGGLLGQFHGFQLRAFSRMLQLSSRLGPEGKKAAAVMGLGVTALAGLNGLPFVKDAENGYDQIRKWMTHKDPNVEAELRNWLTEHSGFGKLGADMVLRGPLSTALGVDLTDRLGFGDPISRTLSSHEFFGAAPSIISGAVTRGATRAMRGDNAAAVASELAPNAVKGPLQAYGAWPAQGVRSATGRRPMLSREKVSPADQARRAAGFEPLSVTEAYEKREDALRRKRVQ